MKKKITTLLVALCLVGTTFSQQKSNQMRGKADSKLLSKCTQGDYTVSRYLVKETSPDNNEFSVKYKINLSRLISTYDNNADELKGLHAFISEIQSDTLKQIVSINVTGFASPDGPTSLNENLAMERAKDFRQYINKKYNLQRYQGTTKAEALKWEATTEAIRTSSIPNRSEVLDLVKSGESESSIESQLKAMPQSWSYMKSKILPPMRCVELWVKYNSWKVEESRALTCDRPEEIDIIERNYFFIVTEEPEGAIINNSSAPLDYDNDKFKDKFKLNRHREKYKDMDRMGRSRQRLREKDRFRKDRKRKNRRYY